MLEGSIVISSVQRGHHIDDRMLEQGPMTDRWALQDTRVSQI